MKRKHSPAIRVIRNWNLQLFKQLKIKYKIMNNYVLFCYDSSTDIWCEYKTSKNLKALKNYVAEQRNEHYLGCEMYIRSNTRIVKRYKAIYLF